MKMNIVRRFGLPTLVIGVAASLGIASPAKANLTITVTDNNAATLTVTAGAGIHTLTITGALLQGTFGYLDTTSVVSASTDQGTGDPFRQISQSSTFKIVSSPPTAGTQVLTVTASEDGFAIPIGDPKFLSSTASVSFGLTSTGDTGQYQGFADPGNVLGGMTVANTLIGPFVDPNGGNNSFSGNSDTKSFSSALYSLTNVTVSSLTNNSDQVQVQGTTSVLATPPTTSTPEPATVLTAGLGGVIGLFMLRRKGKSIV